MIGFKIKKYRELRNLSQEYMAEKLGITQAAYSKIENNHNGVSVEKIKKIAEVLEVPEAELLSEQLIFNVSNQEISNGGVGGGNYISTLNSFQKELYEKLVSELKEELSSLRQERKTMIDLLKNLSLNK